ncbi:MAG TPA: hypothetical protein VFS14_03320 [Candidatus Saccharimonadales bacterium]|nr:hypothetical protein [Candidatus Saccharimonadales bacterium]
MPRVTFEMYCRQHLNLKNTWKYAPGHFAKISAENQWRLHDYFRPSEDLTRDELHKHWLEVRKDPSSSHPQCAGRAYTAMRPYIVNAPIKVVSVPVEHTARGKNGQKVVRVEGLVRPEIDVEKFAKALLSIAKDMRQKEKGN